MEQPPLPPPRMGRQVEIEQGRRRAYASRVCRPSAMASKRAWSCSSSPAAVAAAAASMIQLRVSFLEEEGWKGDKGKANKTVTQSLLEQNAAAHGALWAGPFWKGESP